MAARTISAFDAARSLLAQSANRVQVTTDRNTIGPLLTHIPGYSKIGKRVVVDGKDCLNMATHNYLGMADEDIITTVALNGLKKYGVGSCGPRGFYGTVGACEQSAVVQLTRNLLD